MQTMVSTAGGALVQPPDVSDESVPVLTEGERDEDDLQPGAKAGPWIVERELGRGGMGSVYAVTHDDIGKRAALKVMHRRLIAGSSSAERILLEAKVVNQVGHPNIVDIFETGALPDGRPYIVMERLEGMPLSFRADEGKILPDQVIDILLQVCDALIAAHAANVVHRDLKLDNIFLIDNPDAPTHPRVKVLDWGIAKVISTDVKHTVEGQLVGTPQYLSPEQARGAAVSPQTDVYSLGVMAYELFLEQLPFEAETSAEIMAMHLRCTPPPPSEMWPDIPPVLENLLLAMLAKDPDARPTMLSVAHTLETVRAELEQRRHAATADDVERAVSVILPERRSSRRIISAAGLAPTEKADEWLPRTQRRWPVALGALAIVASTLVFLITRDTDRADASTPPAHVTEAIAPTAPTTASDLEPHAALTASSEVMITPTPLPTGDTLVVPTPAPSAERPVADKPIKKSSRPVRKVRVTPRTDQPLDPDGTLDPYR